MKKIYLALLMASTIVLSGQEVVDIHAPKNQEEIGLKLYPNPAFNDVVYVTTKKNDRKDIIVYDVFGEVVLRDRIFNNALNISRLVPGVYLLRVTENQNTMTRKLVVK